MNAPLYITKITSKLSAEVVMRARRRGITVYGETLASSIGCSLRGVKDVKKLYYITSPPIRNDPETPRALLKHLAM